ncbi:hypothetical protein RHGRI_007358 [Rhododendron griersonianum]|uniref:non-specific serine/threonine protein kinase n=1 Tax=Rhododendron griersonianum TaxID=479676 RepID=A0AAV6KXA9_9ERIC|nr:hypothetical protein RHGRI_007358 [Rhododendron griersonianum]
METPGRRSSHFPENQTGPSPSTRDDRVITVEDSFQLEVYGNERETASSYKSWAQQTQESYQLQLALALRLSAEATCADDPNFLEPGTVDSPTAAGSASAEVLSHRFWLTGCMSYCDKVPDGFYLIHGMDPYLWSMSTDLEDSGRVPSFDTLKAVDPADGSPTEVVLIDKSWDSGLKELQSMVHSLSSNWITRKEVVDHLAELVCNRMGGVASSGEECFDNRWKEGAGLLKDCLGSVMLPIGSLCVGFCVHRALLFKVLADMVNLPCRIAKGCKYCERELASSCLVRFDNDRVEVIYQSLPIMWMYDIFREYVVDLIGRPGSLSHPDSLINGISSVVVSSPLCHPKFRTVESAGNFRMFARLYFSDCQSLNIAFDDASSGRELFLNEKDLDIRWNDLVLKEKIGSGSFGTVHLAEWRGSDVAVKILMEQDFDTECFEEFQTEVSIMERLRHPNIVLFMGAVTQPPNLSIVTEYLSRGSLYKLLQMHGAGVILDDRQRLNMAYDVVGLNQVFSKFFSSITFARTHWVNDTQRRDACLANNCTEKLVVSMTGQGNELPSSAQTPHRPSRFEVSQSFGGQQIYCKVVVFQVCDFGLSRSKANTFLSSKTAAGTPEWMAPEILRGEPSNEKSDVYSFGVILWELVTLQQPWRNLDPRQVVVVVGFKGKRLKIPSNVNPQVAALIEACWAEIFPHEITSNRSGDWLSLGNNFKSSLRPAIALASICLPGCYTTVSGPKTA